MIGGGIFSVLGLAARIAGHAAPVALGIGAFVAAAAGYSYARLAVTYPRDGASYTYLERAYPGRPEIGSLTGWTVVLGYVGTLALYAFTFGAYGADLLGFAGSVPWRIGLGLLVLLAFLTVNLLGVREAGVVEDVVVATKIAILGFFGFVGLFQIQQVRLVPFLDHGAGSVFTAGALIFVAYEGFQLTTNAVEETRDPERALPRAIYTSVALVGVIYVVLAFVAVGTLPLPDLVAAGEYALAAVAQPLLGDGGRLLVALAALLATSSAVNSTLFGASRLIADMAHTGAMPSRLARRSARGVPVAAVVAMSLPAAALMLLGSLDLIAAFSSMTFLLVSLAVSVANLRLRTETRAHTGVVALGIGLMVITIGLLVGHLVASDRGTLAGILLGYLLALLLEVGSRRLRRHAAPPV